jgi:hypothetical protein
MDLLKSKTMMMMMMVTTVMVMLLLKEMMERQGEGLQGTRKMMSMMMLMMIDVEGQISCERKEVEVVSKLGQPHPSEPNPPKVVLLHLMMMMMMMILKEKRVWVSHQTV